MEEIKRCQERSGRKDEIEGFNQRLKENGRFSSDISGLSYPYSL